jgi:hypothetical protein
MSPSDERRHYRRYHLEIPVEIGLYLPEISVHPLQFSGRTIDLSDRGLLVQVPVPQEHYEEMLGQRTVVKVIFPATILDLHLMGFCVWQDQIVQGGQRFSRFGINLEELDDSTKISWLDFVRSLTSQAAKHGD